MKYKFQHFPIERIGRFFLFFITLQLCIWYGGLADLIPQGLLNFWNTAQMGITAIAFFACIIKQRISKVTLVLLLYKLTLLFSTILNGREINIIEFSRYFGLILLLELFSKNSKTLIKSLMFIFEIMIYYNLFTCIQNGPDLFGAYYGALGYDNGFPPYLLAGYLIAYNYHREENKWLRFAFLVTAIHLTIFLTFSATGVMGIVVVDILLLLSFFKNIKISLFQSYLTLIGLELAIVFFRIQNLFSFIIVDLLDKDLTFTGRTKDWDLALNLIPNNLLFGHGMMDQATEKIVLGDVFCHNSLLEQLFRGGIVYFLVFSFAIFMISKQLKKINSITIQNSILIMCGYWVLAMTEVVLEGTIMCSMLSFLYIIGKQQSRTQKNKMKGNEQSSEKNLNYYSSV